MYYRAERDNKKFANIKYARKVAIDSLAAETAIYEGNMVGEWKVGTVKKVSGVPYYITKNGTWRLSKSGDARKVKDVPAPFGL